MGLTDSVSTLRGVGPAKVAAYERLGIHTLSDLLHHFPRAFENRGDTISLAAAAERGVRAAVILTIGTEPRSTRIRGRMSLLKFRAFDDADICEITYYNQAYLKDKFLPGLSFRFWGKVEKKGKKYVMNSPEAEPITQDAPLRELVPVYHLTEGISANQITANIHTVMGLSATIEDPLPDDIRLENRLCTLGAALRNIHEPDSFRALAAAKRRLMFDEFFIFALGLALTRHKRTDAVAPALSNTEISPFLATLPYQLTGAQSRVIDEIRADLARPVPMSRIVVGDVGCGKTVVAAAAMYVAVKNGRQAVLMAPTEILARQHYTELSPLLERLGIPARLLIGATTAADKRRIYEGLAHKDADKRIPVVIGTQALLSDGVTLAAPGLIVTDEQHRFGVHQRAVLAEKNEHAHMLVMSATPIPRTLALALYGDLALSRIDEMPAGRQRVDTFAVDESYRERLIAFIRRQIEEGGQVYVVCPAVEEAEADEVAMDEIDADTVCKKPPIKAALTHAEELQSALPEYRVGCVYGAMKSKDKERVMQAFAKNELQILVATTVIEVGINVPNASLMIVENAERFGLSQLHQLRGRVGRGTRRSYCVLVSQDAQSTTPAGARLAAMHTTYDGFEIAEKDLALRGPGDFLSGSADAQIRQSGGFRFRMATLCDDTGLMSTAFAAASKLCGQDPLLERHAALRETVGQMFSLDAASIS